jgi:succinate-semialdehyde dehydrogenase / glutarate-semialdehyde dehydrogenase
VRKLSFTGSTEVGRQLMAQCAGTIKRISLELGGNAPFIVFDDADLDAAVDGAIAAKFRNAGQTCVCANRIYAQAGIYDTFVERLSAKVATLKVGDGFEPGVDIGPLIDTAAVSKVREHVADALAKGGRLVTGAPSAGEQSHFLAPMVIADSTESMLVAHEETFGPLAPVFRFETEEDAIRLANDTEYGLAAYFYTRDHARAWRVVERLECGMVGHNTGLISNEVVPFGGVKQSGLGREGSRYGIDEYIEIKYWCSAI